MIGSPKIACCNNIADVQDLTAFVHDYGFEGVEWSFTPENTPHTDIEIEQFVRDVKKLRPLEVRFHAAIPRIDLGCFNDADADRAMETFQHLCRLTSLANGKWMTIHLGLGRDSTYFLSWDRTIRRLKRLNQYARSLGVGVCLENLAWGWTSKPHLFEKLVRKSGVDVTFDIGHCGVSESIQSLQYDIDDFITPHPERVLESHIYNIETSNGHEPPDSVTDLKDRLDLLLRLPNCDWWLLELRETKPLLQTLDVVNDYLFEKYNLGVQTAISFSS